MVSPPPDASAGGIWQGTESSTGLEILGLVTETGEAHFIRSDGVQYFGTVEVDVNSVSGDFTGVTPIGFIHRRFRNRYWNAHRHRGRAAVHNRIHDVSDFGRKSNQLHRVRDLQPDL